MWTADTVLLLFEKNKNKNLRKIKQSWRKRTQSKNRYGLELPVIILVNFSWDQLQNKWKSLIRTYKSIRDNNNETGRSRKSWIFFDAMDKLMGKNPTIDPPVAFHNGKCITKLYPSDQLSTASSNTAYYIRRH